MNFKMPENILKIAVQNVGWEDLELYLQGNI